MRLFGGADLGQQRDPSAVVFVEAVGERTLSGLRLPTQLHVRHCERLPLGTPYGRVVGRIAELHEATWATDPHLVVDQSGVGRPVVEALRERRVPVVAATITGGNSETRVRRIRPRDEDWTVSRARLFQVLSGVVYSGRLRISADLGPAARLLLQELEDLEARTSAAGQERVAVASGADHHADLVSALSLAVWRAEQPAPGKVSTFKVQGLLNR